MQLLPLTWILFLLAFGLGIYGALTGSGQLWGIGLALQQFGSLLATLLIRALGDLPPERHSSGALWLTAIAAGWLVPSLLLGLLIWGLLIGEILLWSIPLVLLALLMAPFLLHKLF